MRDMLSHSVEKIVPFLPALAHAHGDDDITAASFIGPMVGFIVFVAVVGLGKALLRMILKRA